MALGSWHRFLLFSFLYYLLMFAFFDSRIVVARMEPAKTVKNPQANDATSWRFTWEIKGFSSLNERKLYSDTFELSGHKWRILVFPKGNGENYLSLYLDVADSAVLPTGWSRHARFSLAVLNQFSRRRSVRKETTHRFNSVESDWGFTSFMPHAELLDPCRGFLVNDVIIVELEIQECSSNDSEQILRTEHEKIEILVPPTEIQCERGKQILRTEQEPVKIVVPTIKIQCGKAKQISKTQQEPVKILVPTINIQCEKGKQILKTEHEPGELLVPTVEIQSETEVQTLKTKHEPGELLVPTVEIQSETEEQILKTEHETFEVLIPTKEIQKEAKELKPVESELAKDEAVVVVASHGDSPCQEDVGQATIVTIEGEGLDIKVSDQAPILSEEVQGKGHEIKDEVTVDQAHFAEEGNNQVLQSEHVSLDNDQSTIVTPKISAVQSELESETVNIKGFLVLVAQADSIKQIFEKHPDLALNCRLHNVELRSAFIAFLYAVIDVLCQSVEDISDDDLRWAKEGLVDLEYGGFQVDWLKRKLEEICEKKEQARGCRLDELTKQFEQVKAMMLKLESQLEKEKAETAAAKAPLSFNQII